MKRDINIEEYNSEGDPESRKQNCNDEKTTLF